MHVTNICITFAVCLIVVVKDKMDTQKVKSEGSISSPTEVVNEKAVKSMETGLSSTDIQHQSQELEQIEKNGDQTCSNHEQNNVMQDQPMEQKQSSENKTSDQELHPSQDQLSEQTQDSPNQDLKQEDQQPNQDQGDDLKLIEEPHEQSNSQQQVQQTQPDDTVQQISVDEQESSNVVVTSEPQTPVKSKPLSNALVPMTWPKVYSNYEKTNTCYCMISVQYLNLS